MITRMEMISFLSGEIRGLEALKFGFLDPEERKKSLDERDMHVQTLQKQLDALTFTPF